MTYQDELKQEFFQQSPILQALGFSLSFSASGDAVIEMPYNPLYNHSGGAIHGGIYMTLLDSAGWFASALQREGRDWIATSEISVHLLKPAQNTSLRAVGRVIRNGRRQIIAEAHLYNQDGELVGHGIGTYIPTGREEHKDSGII